MTPYFQRDGVTIYCGDVRAVLAELPDESVHCCVTSPPYWGLRDYGTGEWVGGDLGCDHKGDQRWYTENTAAVSSAGAFSEAGELNAERLKKGRWREAGQCECGARRVDMQTGLEKTPAEYVDTLVEVFSAVRGVLRDDGTLWLNLGDSYNAYNGGAGPSSKLSRGAQTTERPQLATGYGLRDKSLKPKDLVGIPWQVALALRDDGWYLRQDIIWSKPNPMPESVTDRCTKSHEYLFLLSKSDRYHYDQQAILEPITEASIERLNQPTLDSQYGSDRVPGKTNGPMKAVRRSGNISRKPAIARGVPVDTDGSTSGAVAGSVPWEGSERNKRSVWTVTTKPYKGAHFAVFPPKLIEPCILAGCPEGGVVLDPFLGSGTTAAVAQQYGRQCVGIELNQDYCKLAAKRFRQRRLLTPESV